MKIIIAGAGKIGGSLAAMLSDEGYDVTVIEKNPETIRHISNELDVICVEGSATNHDTLKDAGAEDADILVAATEQDEVNMICAIAASKLGTGHVIARIRDPGYLRQTEFLREALGLSLIINPEFECAKEISRMLRFPGAVRVDAFSKGSIEIAEHKIGEGSVLKGLKLRELPKKFGAKILIGVIERGLEVFIPNGEFELAEGDTLSIAGASNEVRKFFVDAGQYRKPVKTVMIMGGSRICVYLTRMLIENGMKVTVIEKDQKHCERLCELIPEAKIVCGDATRSEVLQEEGIGSVDAFVSLTGDDGDNIITSLYAKSCNVGKIVTKVNHEHFAKILENAGLESFVIPKDIVAQQIVGRVQGLSNSVGSSMETLRKLADGRVEALEFKVGADSACVGKPLRELKLKPNILISAVIRGSKSIIPDGSTSIQAGDHAIIVTSAGRLRELDEIFER